MLTHANPSSIFNVGSPHFSEATIADEAYESFAARSLNVIRPRVKS